MKIFVGCSSIDKIDDKYKKIAKELAIALANKKHDLVFGACNLSSMGVLYRTMKEYNRKITGIVPEAYKTDLNELECDLEIITQNCANRNLELIRQSDAIVFLEGGIGTLQEILTSIEAKRTKEFDKPIVIINKLGYFDNLISTLETAYSEGFSGHETKKVYFITTNIEDAISYIDNYDYSV